MNASMEDKYRDLVARLRQDGSPLSDEASNAILNLMGRLSVQHIRLTRVGQLVDDILDS